MHFIQSTESTTVILDGKPYTVAADQPAFASLNAALAARDTAAVKAIVDPPLAKIREIGSVSIYGGHVTYNGVTVNDYIVQRILEADDPEPFARFLANSMENPDLQARKDLYRWVEASKLPITSDGYIIGLKSVTTDYKDHHTGKFDNSLGAIVEQARELCDPNPTVTCSRGLHFGGPGYFQSGHSGVLLMVKVHPRDVVAFPNDYHLQKARCCRYEVVGQVDAAPSGLVVYDPPTKFRIHDADYGYYGDGIYVPDVEQAKIFDLKRAWELKTSGFRKDHLVVEPVT